MLFAFFAAMAETERENIREATLEGLNAAARKGRHGGRPPVITDDMLHTVLRGRARRESVESIRPDLIIPAGKRKGHTPSPASIYRAIAEHEKRQSLPRGRRPSPCRLRLCPDQRLIDRPLESPLLNEPPRPYPPDLRRVLLRPRTVHVLDTTPMTGRSPRCAPESPISTNLSSSSREQSGTTWRSDTNPHPPRRKCGTHAPEEPADGGPTRTRRFCASHYRRRMMR